MRNWEKSLKINSWQSDFSSVNKCLTYYSRKVKSEGTRSNFGTILNAFCKFCGRNPEDIIGLSSEEASNYVQNYVDSLALKERSIRYVNMCLAYLKTFFKVNGFKGDRALEVERHYQPSRYRKRGEYIPTSNEIHDMSLAAGSLRNKALILGLYTSGLRNSTIRAVLFKDVKEELDNDLKNIKMPVYSEMKRIDSGACKGNIPYYSFFSKEATRAVRVYLSDRERTQGNIGFDEPLFCADSSNMTIERKRHTLVLKKSLEALVKNAARKAGIVNWKDVYPHCLREAFEGALRNSGVDIKDQEFLMGHILPGVQDTYYDKTKTKYLRGKYKQVIFFPERGFSEEQRKRQILDTVKLLGYSDDKIKRVEEVLAKYKNIDDGLDEIKKLSLTSNKEQKPTENKTETTNKYSLMSREVRIVKGENKLLHSLNHNWDLIKELSDQRFVVQKLFD